MPQYDLTNGWTLDDDGVNVLITGPGQVGIALCDFTPSRLIHETRPCPAVLAAFRQFGWTYPLPEGELVYLVLWHPDDPEHSTWHLLHVGSAVSWELPNAVGERLQAWFVRMEEGHRVP